MTTPKQPPAKAGETGRTAPRPDNEEPGTNAVEHEPDPKAVPIPDGDHPYVPRSPYTTGNY